MFETAGPLAIVKPTTSLVGLVALPFVWALLAALPSRPSRESARGKELLCRTIAVSGAVGTLALAVAMAARLGLLPKGHVLLQHLGQLGRLGQLDLAFDLVLDPNGAAFALVVAVISCASVLETTWSRAPLARLAWTGLAASGAMLLCTGDGFAPILVGLGVLTLAAWGLSRGGQLAADVMSLAGGVSVMVGFVFLFWSLGGAFGPEGYDPDNAPRFVLVATPGTAAAATSSDSPEHATLSMTSHAGALVSSDESAIPGEPVASPFSIAAPPGVYTLRVHRGGASGDVVVPRVGLVAGSTHVLTPYGPTASLRALGDQFAVPRLTPSREIATVRDILSTRQVGGVRASSIVLLFVLGGALARVHALARRRGASALATTLEAVVAPYLAIRLAPLVDPMGGGGALVMTLGVGSAVVLAARAASLEEPHDALRSVLAATCSLALGAIGLGEPAAALVIACTSLVATSAALVAVGARMEVRWLGVAAAATVGLIPAAGASSGYVLAVAAALGSSAAGTSRWAIFAGLVASGVLLTVALGALASFRVYDATIRATARAPGASRARAAIAIVLSGVALGGGIALGAGTAPFGGQLAPVASRLAGEGLAPPVPRALVGGAVLLCLVAAAAGALVARRTSAACAPPSWLAALGRPYAAVAWAARGVPLALRYLARAVNSTERDVIEALPLAVSSGMLRATRLVGRSIPSFERRERPLASAKVGTFKREPPRSADRIEAAVLLAMVALLGGVVLSSFLLR